MKLLYNFGIRCYRAVIGIASLGNSKARKWLDGRKNWRQILKTGLDPATKRIWMHCASLGEFEQGRPVLDEIKNRFPEKKIVVSFFSPSGYLQMKDYDGAELVTYLPLDTKQNARDFIRLVNPEMALFVKYEFWYHYLNELSNRQIPTYIIAATFRPSQRFFKWYGAWWKKLLLLPDHIFTQDQASMDLLTGINVRACSVSGDTRFDRVAQIAERSAGIPLIEDFKGQNKLIIGGSTWPPEERLLAEILPSLDPNTRLCIAPHDVSEKHLVEIEERFSALAPTTRFSGLSGYTLGNVRVILIDSIGILSRLYRHGDIAIVGGAFGSGLHNILEPIAHGLPILFGPEYQKQWEASYLIRAGVAVSITNKEELGRELNRLLNDEKQYDIARNSALKAIKDNRGATGKILLKVISGD